MSNRRDFIKSALAGTAAASLSSLPSRGEEPKKKIGKIDHRALGKIKTPVSIVGLGLGSAFTRPYKDHPDEGRALLEQALEHGINYWDTCRGYDVSEDIIGPVVGKRRNEIYLVTKSGGRDYDSFMRDVDTSLRKLETDHIDLLHVWNLKANENLDQMEKGCFKAIQKLKDEKVIGHYGITGHSGADILVQAVKRFDPDAMLTVFPCTRSDEGKYEDDLLPLARERNMGVIAMKTVRHARGADLKGTDLIRYALSLEGVHSAIVGLDTLAHLRDNLEIASNFIHMPEDERAELSKTAVRVLANTTEPWNRPGYQDGKLV